MTNIELARKEFKEKGHTHKLWDFFFKTKNEENETTVLDFFNGLKKYNECNLRDWLKAENFEGQDFVPQDVYDLLRGANRISAEAMQIMSEELAESLNLRVINES